MRDVISSSLSETWILETMSETPRLRHPSDGTILEMEGVTLGTLSNLWERLRCPVPDLKLRVLFDVFGPQGDEILELFREHKVIHASSDRPQPLISGTGRLSRVLRDFLERRGSDVGPIHCCCPRELLGSALTARGAGVLMTIVSSGLLVLGSACSGCTLLRVLGTIGCPGTEQTQLLIEDEALTDDEIRAFAAEALLVLEPRGLSEDECLFVRSDWGIARGTILPHPDCPCCVSSDTGGTAKLDELRSELKSNWHSDTDSATIRQVFGNSAFAPVTVAELPSSDGKFLFDGPYMAGDTRLSRYSGTRVFSTSIPGIVHGSSSSPERARLLAWSEGVERLAAQSARPDIRLPRGHNEVTRTLELYSWSELSDDSEEHELSYGLDLIRNSECLVPFERVGVNVPRQFTPFLKRMEPTFTGAASHVSYLAAILHGTVEVLKRDAFMIAWYRKRKLKHIQWPDALPGDLAARAGYLQSHGLCLRLYDLRSDLPLPIVLLDVRATHRVGNWPTGGALWVPAAGFTAMEALGHALSLACSRFVGLGLDDSPERDPLNPDAIRVLSETIPFWPGLVRYLDPARSHELEFVESGRTIEFEQLDNDAPTAADSRFALLRSWLKDAALDWIAVPLGDSFVAQAGLRVVKSIVPQAVRLTLTQAEVDIRSTRLTREWAGSESGALNELCHPLY